MCNETIQPPETNGTIFLLGPCLLGAEFVRGRVCQGPRCPGIRFSYLFEVWARGLLNLGK